MNKREFYKICSLAQEERLNALSDELSSKYKVQLITEPHKTLVMLKARESVKNSLFYLGEALATECMVSFEGTRGYSLTLGDCFKKATAIAVLDGALNAKIPECSRIIALMAQLGHEQEEKRKAENTKILTSRVRFDTMEV